ncbi:MAG: HDOD domain-containing protein [Desulfohalobiaceae bacterium]|nr:HDOD domain-containing protein [Desulfohalobiaceae bacterium]
MQRVSVNKATPGMVLEDDVRDQKGRFLFKAGQSITDKHIRIFKIWGVTEIWTENEQSGKEEAAREDASIPEETLDRAEDLVRESFRDNSLEDPFIGELYRICVERTAQSLHNDWILPAEDKTRSGKGDAPETPPRAEPRNITIPGLVSDRLKLATLPNIYYKTLEAVHDPSMSLADIADIVSTDPSLSAKILQLVNSSFYSLLKKVDTLTRALALIGTNHLMTIVTGVSVMSIFKKSSSTILSMNEFWQHSIGCGIIARMLASYVPGVVNSERYFVAGLLHDIGRLIMVQNAPRQMQSVFHIAEREDLPLFEAEKRHLGFDHTEVGEYLAHKWNLPLSLKKMIRYHHEPELGSREMDPEIIYVANFLTTALRCGSSGEDKIPSFNSGAWMDLSLSPSVLEPVVIQLNHQLKETFELIYGHH